MEYKEGRRILSRPINREAGVEGTANSIRLMPHHDHQPQLRGAVGWLQGHVMEIWLTEEGIKGKARIPHGFHPILPHLAQLSLINLVSLSM